MKTKAERKNPLKIPNDDNFPCSLFKFLFPDFPLGRGENKKRLKREKKLLQSLIETYDGNFCLGSFFIPFIRSQS